MSTTVLSLFGDEVVPEQVKAVGKSRAVPKEEPKVEKQASPKEKKPAEAKTPAVKKPKPGAKKKTAGKPEKKQEVKGAILEGWTPDKQYYSIGEVASLFHVATSHIRFWTNEFALKVRTTRKGDRLYSPEQINELRVIYHLVKENGYTIAGAKARLKDTKKAPAQAIDLKQSLLQLRNKLVEIKNQI